MNFLSEPPKVNREFLSKPMSEAEIEVRCRRTSSQSKIDWRKFVSDVRAGRLKLSSWDMPMSFDEFARRVEAGEYD